MNEIYYDQADLLGNAQLAVERAALLGADASALVESQSGAHVSVADGEVDTAGRDAAQNLTVTVYKNGRTGSASTGMLDDASIVRTVEEAVAIADKVQADVYAGLPPPDWLAIHGRTVTLHASETTQVEDLLFQALAIDKAGRGGKRRVTGAGAFSSEGAWALANSLGFSRSSMFSFHGRWCSILAEDGEQSVQDHHEHQDRRPDFLPAARDIAKVAVDRALASRGGRAVSSRRAPVLFEPRVASAIIGDLVQALGGHAQYRGASFLPSPLGRAVSAAEIDLNEDPFEPFGLASGPFDREGVAGKQRALINGGEAQGLFLSTLTARRLGMESTGNANGPYNLTFSSRTPGGDRQAMLNRLGTGLLVSQILGGATEPVSGSWTRAVAGFWVENGEIVHAVRDVTLAGTMPQMLQDIVCIGQDIERTGPFRTGSILIGSMQIGSAA